MISTYKLLPLVMTLLLRLLLLLWLVIGRGFGKVFLRNKSWRKNANGCQSTIECWKGTWAMFLAEPPLPVCPPHPLALHTPGQQHRVHHQLLVSLIISYNMWSIRCIRYTWWYRSGTSTCFPTTANINSHFSTQLQPLFLFPRSKWEVMD